MPPVLSLLCKYQLGKTGTGDYQRFVLCRRTWWLYPVCRLRACDRAWVEFRLLPGAISRFENDHRLQWMESWSQPLYMIRCARPVLYLARRHPGLQGKRTARQNEIRRDLRSVEKMHRGIQFGLRMSLVQCYLRDTPEILQFDTCDSRPAPNDVQWIQV